MKRTAGCTKKDPFSPSTTFVTVLILNLAMVGCARQVGLFGNSSSSSSANSASEVADDARVENASATTPGCESSAPVTLGNWTVSVEAGSSQLQIQGNANSGDLTIGALPDGNIFLSENTDGATASSAAILKVTCVKAILVKTGTGPKNVFIRLGPKDGKSIERFDGNITVRSEGTSGTTVIKGSAFSDRIYDGPGDDTIIAGLGNDEIHVNQGGGDQVFAGPGNDRIEVDTVSPAPRFRSLMLQGGSGTELIRVSGGGISSSGPVEIRYANYDSVASIEEGISSEGPITIGAGKVDDGDYLQ